MPTSRPYLGSLFAEDFLRDRIRKLPDWIELSDAELDGVETQIRALLAAFPANRSPNESQTEDDLIWPALRALGWTESLRQQNLSARGRQDVPDGILFLTADARQRANALGQDWQRYRHGCALVESKRWRRPLDRLSARRGEGGAPSTQMLRYLRRVDDLTDGALRWGILTNGASWRLYFSGAQSVADQFLDMDLAAILGVPEGEGCALARESRRHWLKVFVLAFRRRSFLPGRFGPQSFHQRAIEEGRFHRERVAANLSELMFGRVFPDLAGAMARAAPDAPPQELHDAALVLLYRLLFVLYAEDRDLLPASDPRYRPYMFRDRVRVEIGLRKDRGDGFSGMATGYWQAFDDLCRAIDEGDPSIGLPPYNGGLFDRDRTPLLLRIRLDDRTLADVIDAMSFERVDGERRYINYRDLGVQQLGSIYERLLEQELVKDGDGVAIRPTARLRRDSGSYYTPDELVGLIVEETVEPFVRSRMEAFQDRRERLAAASASEEERRDALEAVDPATALLDLKICDPAMGSGHFLVHLVDRLADRVIGAMAEAEAVEDGYVSPLADVVRKIRGRIKSNARQRGWTFDTAQLDDRHIVRRMVLKRCVYGVDKNPLAVELAKVSLWLHSFTVGAPLSFLDHHLRCGDSLFGTSIRSALDQAERDGSLFLQGPLSSAIETAAPMQLIEGLADVEIAEAQKSADIFAGVRRRTRPIQAFLSLLHAFEWLNLRDRRDRTARLAWLDGLFGDPVDIALGKEVPEDAEHAARFSPLLRRARALVESERFLNWQVTFPGVWSDWEADRPSGGFDAVVGNPPWDAMKLQQVEWFAARRPEIAGAPRAADRRRMVAALERAGDPLAREFAEAGARAAAAMRMARQGGDYPLLSGGDVNLYSLFTERAMALLRPGGMAGLLVPSGIASDRTAARFFRAVRSEGRLRALYDFENRRTRHGKPPFFPDVDSRFKFCVFVAGSAPLGEPAKCAFFLQDPSERDDPERRFDVEEFSRVNPNTGTAPVFRTARDAALVTSIYRRLPVLADRSAGKEAKTWPVRHVRMFDITNDSGLFRNRGELEEEEGAWRVGGNRFDSPSGEWAPLYEGKMVRAFDHRAAGVAVNLSNLHHPGQPSRATLAERQDPGWLPEPQHWVPLSACGWSADAGWTLGFRRIARPTDMRTCIAAICPAAGFGNTLPLLKAETPDRSEWLLAANLNARVFDYVLRQKLHGATLNLFILEQLPVVPPEQYAAARFGPRTAAEIVREAVLELVYTSHDMAPFARHLGHVDESGKTLPPFRWEPGRRLALFAKLDALYFHLYGVTEREDVRYVHSTFPIVERRETKAWGGYRSCELCLEWMNALAAGRPDADVRL